MAGRGRAGGGGLPIAGRWFGPKRTHPRPYGAVDRCSGCLRSTAASRHVSQSIRSSHVLLFLYLFASASSPSLRRPGIRRTGTHLQAGAAAATGELPLRLEVDGHGPALLRFEWTQARDGAKLCLVGCQTNSRPDDVVQLLFVLQILSGFVYFSGSRAPKRAPRTFAEFPSQLPCPRFPRRAPRSGNFPLNSEMCVSRWDRSPSDKAIYFQMGLLTSRTGNRMGWTHLNSKRKSCCFQSGWIQSGTKRFSTPLTALRELPAQDGPKPFYGDDAELTTSECLSRFLAQDPPRAPGSRPSRRSGPEPTPGRGPPGSSARCRLCPSLPVFSQESKRRRTDSGAAPHEARAT